MKIFTTSLLMCLSLAVALPAALAQQTSTDYAFAAADVSRWAAAYNGVKSESPEIWTADEWAGFYLSDSSFSLSKSEIDSIGYYKADGFVPINHRLSNKPIADGTDVKKIDTAISDIRNLISKLKSVPVSVKVYRGSHSTGKVGEYHHFSEFLSTSFTKSDAEDFALVDSGPLWTITLPVNQKGIKMELYLETTQTKGQDLEDEFLLPDGVWMKINQVTPHNPQVKTGIDQIDAEVIPANAAPDCHSVTCVYE